MGLIENLKIACSLEIVNQGSAFLVKSKQTMTIPPGGAAALNTGLMIAYGASTVGVDFQNSF